MIAPVVKIVQVGQHLPIGIDHLIDDLRALTGYPIRLAVSTPVRIQEAINRVYERSNDASQKVLEDLNAPDVGADDDLEYLVTRVRAKWPNVRIRVRGDCGFGARLDHADDGRGRERGGHRLLHLLHDLRRRIEPDDPDVHTRTGLGGFGGLRMWHLGGHDCVEVNPEARNPKLETGGQRILTLLRER